MIELGPFLSLGLDDDKTKPNEYAKMGERGKQTYNGSSDILHGPLQAMQVIRIRMVPQLGDFLQVRLRLWKNRALPPTSTKSFSS